MTSIGVQLNPSRKPGVVLRRDPRDPDRLYVLPRLLGGASLFGLVLLGLGGFGQLEALREDSAAGLVFATLLAWGGAAAVTLRPVSAIDRARRVVEERFGRLLPVHLRSHSLAGLERVTLEVRSNPASQGVSTAYPVRLEGPGVGFEVDDPGYWEPAVGLAEPLAAFLDVPMTDPGRSGTRAPEELDRPLGDQARSNRRHRPADSALAVVADGDDLLQVRIPRPYAKQFGCLSLLVGLFCMIPVTIEVLVPLLRGYSLQGRLGSLAFFCFPIALVGGAALRILLTNGGDLHVTPGRLRMSLHAPWGRRVVEIPFGELEDLVILEPEMGGSRSLLAYFSQGVLVARSDREAVRFGHGLSRKELEWIQSRVRAVMRPRERRLIAPRPAAAAKLDELGFSRDWKWPALGFAAGAVLAHAIPGPWRLCLRTFFLDHVVNVGGALGFAAGLLADPARRRLRDWPGTWGPLAGALLVAALLLVLPRSTGWIQDRPVFTEGRGFSRSFVSERLDPEAGTDAGRREQRLFFAGWLPVSAAFNVVSLEAAAFLLMRLLHRRGMRA